MSIEEDHTQKRKIGEHKKFFVLLKLKMLMTIEVKK